jgi:hypothetical protein
LDSDVNEILASLLAAIETDRNMFIKAKIDPMFDSVRPQVDALLEDVLQKKKINAKKGISNVEFAVQRMKNWFDGGHASNDDVQKYDSIRDKISDAEGKMKTQSYFGYDDALRLMSEANERVDGIQANIYRIKNSSETEFNRYTNELDDVSNKIERLKRKKKLYAVIIILIIDFLFQSLANVLILQGIIFLIIILILNLDIFRKDNLDWDDVKIRIQQLDIINVIIASYIVFMTILLIIGLVQLDFWEILSCIFLLSLPFILIIFKSEEISDLELKQTKLKEQINVLDRQITTTGKSLL